MPSPAPSDSGDEVTCDSAFECAAASVEAAAVAGSLSPSALTRLYALYKIATVGDAPDSAKPALWDLKGRAKWNAWRSVAGMSADAARAAYVAEAAAAGCGGGGGGGGGSADGRPPPSTTTMGPAFSALPTLAGDAPSGLTPLGMAAADGDAAAVAAALAGGADPAGVAEPEDGATPLHLAADAGSVACVRLLLGAGAPAAAQDAHGATPLSYAAAAGREDVVALLRGVVGG